MICPQCKAVIPEDARFCPECGAILTPQARNTAKAQNIGKAAGGAGILLGRAARAARLQADYDAETIIGDRLYNGILLAVLLWGLLVNVLLCVYAAEFVMRLNPVVFLIAYAVCAVVGIFMSAKSRNPLVSFLGYNLVVVPFGLMLSLVVAEYGGISSRVVADAFLYTLLISVGMLGLALAMPQLFAKLGGALLGVLAGLVLCEIVLLLFRVRQDVTDWIAAGLFSLYIGYDVHRSQQFAKTVDNAVDCALDIYLDIANLFLRLLSIMGKKRD